MTHISHLIEQRYTRRSLLKAIGFSAIGGLMPYASFAVSSGVSSLAFDEVPRGMDEHHYVPAGYSAQIFMRWGDAVIGGAPEFTPASQTVAAQEQQFGFNNDFIAYFPIGGSSEHGLLCVNHEYTDPELMFPGGRYAEDLTDDEHRIEMAAHGCSVLEVKKSGREWQPVYGAYNRRVSALTPIRMSGPAAGHKRMQTSADPEGKTVIGMFGNCAGGQTPWQSYLTCEENIDGYFYLHDYEGSESANHNAMTIGKTNYHRWDKIDPRFDVSKEPNEPNRFGWVVEVNPFDPESQPVKRTALGRFKHEGATPVFGDDGRVVVYMGDDSHDEHLYKFITRDRFDAENPSLNTNLLDHGTLYVAQFDKFGKVVWHPLVYGQSPLNEANGFASQADVLIETRRAAKLLGATELDRPEDVDVNMATGRVYAAMSKNPTRLERNYLNRRAPNPMGYVLEITPTDGDHAALTSKWTMFLEGGSPNAPAFAKGSYGGAVSENGWLACPDNLAFDNQGRIWISTDGQPEVIQAGDGLYAADTKGAGRAVTKCFFRAPIGAEVTGPCFTPDNRTLFLAVQHPAEGTLYDAPSTRWPDFDLQMPARASILAITKEDGGVIGS